MMQKTLEPNSLIGRITDAAAENPQVIPLPIEYDTIIISDIHLGSRMCQARELDTFLSHVRVRQLILAGDVFDDLKFNRLQHWHWQALSRIRKISDHCRVIWIRGNHDVVSAATMSHLLGVNVRNNYLWTSNNRTFYAVHGDRWDNFIYRHQILTALLTTGYNLIQRLNTRWTRRFTGWLKKRAKLLTRNSNAVQYGALRFAEKNDIDAIFCGHTHMARLVRNGRIVYGNDGTWQSDDPHFIGILGGRVELCKFVDGNVFLLHSEETGDQRPASPQWAPATSIGHTESSSRRTAPVAAHARA